MSIRNLKTIERFDTSVHTAGIIDIHKQLKKSGSIQKSKDGMRVTASVDDNNVFTEFLDITTWLPFASKEYNTSPDINDYLILPVFTIPTDLPNRNGVAFPLKSLLQFQPEYGMQSYKTFKGKPTFYEHKNDDHTKAYGVIADAFLKNLKGFSNDRIWKLVKLLCFDRTKNVDVTSRLASGELKTFSMGAYVDQYFCSYCNAELGNCKHIKKGRIDFYEKDGQLVFKNVSGVVGFENSAVETPAYAMSIGTRIIDTRI